MELASFHSEVKLAIIGKENTIIGTRKDDAWSDLRHPVLALGLVKVRKTENPILCNLGKTRNEERLFFFDKCDINLHVSII